ncbi:MAG: hypothetical protein OER43_08575 [Gammaproteobacteria bacterium]|nr:hypothetical protein [Gammaproteobacteria bacterium]
MKVDTRYLMQSTLAAVFALGVVALTTAPADAQRKGPRASLASSTHCALDLDFVDPDTLTLSPSLVVTTTLSNKSSGETIPEVRDGSMIQGTYKEKTSRGRAFEILGTVPVEPTPQDVDPELTLTAEFSLCAGQDVREEVAGSRELNGLSTILYGISGGGGATRTVTNRCTDDPDTPENEGGIRTADVIMDIEDACDAVMP